MKKKITTLTLTLLLGLFSWNATAATGWFSDYIKLDVNGAGVAGPTGYKWIGADPTYGISLVAGLGSVTSLILDGADMKYWGDGADRTGGSFFYEVKSADGVTTYIAATEVIWTQTALGGNDFQGISSGLNVNLLAGIPSGTACKLTVWAKSWGSGGDSWLTNGGANYVATFTAYNVLVSGSTSQDGGYSTLGAAITAIGTSQSSNNIEIKIGASTTEDASGISIGAGNWNSLKIFPTAIATIAAATPNTNTTAFISLTGANNVTIDGRINRTGSTRSLTINNSSTSASAAATILFSSDAQNDSIKYCTLKGRQQSGAGIVTFSGTTSVPNGNGLNVIENNLITNNGGLVIYGIYAIGNTTNPNIGNKIINNEFKDILNWSLAGIALNIAGGATAGALPQNNNFTISGNSFYNTTNIGTSTNTARQFIGIGTSSNTYGGTHTITDNFIGGSGPNCSGLLTKSGSNNAFTGMLVYCSGGTTSIQNNTIKNINWLNNTNSAWIGIHVAGTGSVNIGNITGNSIGDNTSTGSIQVTNTSTSSTTTLINIATSGTVDCQNNKIGSITTSNATASITAPINVITKTATAGSTNISNNIIGSTTVAYSIQATNAAVGQNINGILSQGTGSNTISGNTIANITNGTTTGYIYGIYQNGTGSTLAVNKNLIHSLEVTSASTGGVVAGVYCNAGTNTVTNNIISLKGDNPTTLNGLVETTGSVNTSFYHNTVYIGGTPTTLALASKCIASSGAANIRTFKNNILTNVRSNSGTASGAHYAIAMALNSGGTIAVDGNDYISSGTGGILGIMSTTKSDLTAWQSATSQDVNSISVNPSFTNSGGTTPESFVPSSLLLTGVDLSATVTTDYNGVSRTTTPTMGAIDYRIWNGTAWNTAPTTDYNAKIDGTYSGVGFSCRNLILNAGKQLGITSGALDVANNFTILSDATNGTGTFIDNGGTLNVTGTTTVNQSLQHYLTGTLRTWYLTPPVASTTPSGMSIIKSYDEPTYTWSTSLTTMNAKVGYQVVPALAANNISFTGALNTGNQNISLTSRTGIANKAGFNLIGNPYPSYLDWTLVTANGANTALMRSTTMWYRTKSDAGTYNFWTVNGDGVVSPNGANSKIPPMQAFWVRANAGGGTLALTNDMRSHAPNTDKLLKAPAAKNTANTLVRLQVSNGTNADEAVLYFSANASNGLDSYDAPKMSNENAAIPEIYTILGDEQIVINGMNTIPLDAPIGLGFVAGNASSFSIFANEVSNLPSGIKLILKDNVTNAETDLTDGIATYQFSPVLTSSNRFSVIFRTPGAVTSVENPQDKSFLVYNNAPQQLTVICNDLINLGSMVSVYNALGQKLISQKQTATSMQIAGKFIPGVYVVTVNNTTKKVIIN